MKRAIVREMKTVGFQVKFFKGEHQVDGLHGHAKDLEEVLEVANVEILSLKEHGSAKELGHGLDVVFDRVVIEITGNMSDL